MSGIFNLICQRLFTSAVLFLIISISILSGVASADYNYQSTIPSAFYYFDAPFGAAKDSTGNVYVADTYNHRIQKFDSAGVYVYTLGVTGYFGVDNSHFKGPSLLGSGDGQLGNVYIADSGNHRIQKFNAAGVYVSTLGVSEYEGSDNSHFWSPSGVGVDLDNLYVADTVNRRIRQV